MRHSVGIFIATIAAFLLPSVSFAGDLITEPESAVYVSPPTYNDQFSAVMGDASIKNPSWHVDQWGNQNPLTTGNFAATSGAGWSFASTTMRVQFYSAPSGSGTSAIAEHTYELAENGASSAAPLPCGDEFNMFLEANSGSASYKDLSGHPAAARFQTSAPISSLSAVSFSFGLNVLYENISQTCSLNFGAYQVDLTLNSTKGPAMFFQIFLRDTRGSNVDQDNTTCGGYPQGAVYCFSTSLDHISPSQTAPTTTSGRIAYNFNALSNILAAIKLTSDTNPADWTIEGMYYGSAVDGGANITSRWDGMKLTAY